MPQYYRKRYIGRTVVRHCFHRGGSHIMSSVGRMRLGLLHGLKCRQVLRPRNPECDELRFLDASRRCRLKSDGG